MTRNRKRPFSGLQNGNDTTRRQLGERSEETTSAGRQPNCRNAMPRISTATLTAAVPQDTPRFADLATHNILNPTLLQTIAEDLKFDHMTPVQAATLQELLQNKIDCLAQAKTGTGKTIAFLLPAIQTMINSQRSKGSGISTLILSPTRELAMQIAKEANALLRRLPQYRVEYSIGGTNKDREARAILSGCEILVATPGRLLDHLSEPEVQNQLSNLQTLVLDEADRMLDMGFLPDIKKIVNHLPNKNVVHRQSMLFSATIAGQIQSVAHLILKQGYKFISTIPAGEVNTHERVPQYLVQVASMVDVAPAMISVVKAEMETSTDASSFKAIVFAPTAALADFYNHILENVKGLPPVSVLHSRISQSKRTGVTEDFRKAKKAICVATDVIARGMDFPNVTHVFQVGIPADKESYIHRLGRTARADADGRGVFLISAAERFFLYQLKEIDLQPYRQLDYSMSDIEPALLTLENKAKIYQAWMGYYKNHLKGMQWSISELVKQANIFALHGLDCPQVPGLQKSTIGKMGLKGVPGLVVLPNEPGSNDPRRRGGGEGRRGR